MRGVLLVGSAFRSGILFKRRLVQESLLELTSDKKRGNSVLSADISNAPGRSSAVQLVYVADQFDGKKGEPSVVKFMFGYKPKAIGVGTIARGAEQEKRQWVDSPGRPPQSSRIRADQPCEGASPAVVGQALPWFVCSLDQLRW
jgi:hypothetical protein